MNYGGDFGGGGGRGGGGGGYQTTSYSATGGAGAGGFFGGSQGGSQTTPSKAFNKSSLRPCTVKQMLEAQQPHPDATFFSLDGMDVSHVSFVGQVRNIVEQQTNLTLKVDDGTGVVEVKQWLDMNVDVQETVQKGGIHDGLYVRVVGALKEQGGRRHVVTHNIRAVTDYNEILFHLLEATAVHLYFTRGPLESLGQGGGSGGGGGGYGGDTHMTDAGGTGGGGGGGGGGGNVPAGLSANARRALAAIKSVPDSNEGLHVNQIAEKTGMKIADVYATVEELIEMGVGFTTVDDDHIAIMD